jgi:hypothetical protein
MSGFSKQFSANKELKEVFKDLNTWCSFTDIKVVDSEIATTDFRIVGKKNYKSSIKFRWLLAFGLLFLGALMAAQAKKDGGDIAPVSTIMVFLPMVIYVCYYFVQAKGKEVKFEFRGIGKELSATNVSVKLFEDLEDAKAELNQLFIKFL